MAWQSSAVVVDPPLARDVGALWEHRVNISADRLCRTEKLQKAQRVGGPVAGELGFEPRFSESESDVLPLNYSPVELATSIGIRMALTWDNSALLTSPDAPQAG